MRQKKLFATMMAGLLFFGIGGGSTALAADAKDFVITGSVDLGVMSVPDSDASAKFQEYRDLKSGVFSNMRFGGDNGSYFMDFTGDNIGRNDQYFQMEGGRYGGFNYSVYYNEIIHNLSFGAKTFYSGVGSNTLDYSATDRAKNTDAAYTPAISTNANLWASSFDYAIKRKDTGAALDFTFGSPFYVTVDANQLLTKGLKPLGTPGGVYVDRKGVQTSSFGNVIEMPAPVDYQTNNLTLKAGYNTKQIAFSVSGILSKFENANETLTWRNPYVTTQRVIETNTLPGDNNYYKIIAQGALKQLPLNSSLALQAGYAKLKSEISLLNTIAGATSGGAATTPTYAPVTLGLNNPTFSGDIEYNTASLALTSEPVKSLSTKIYYNYLRKHNTSTAIEYTNTSGGSTTDNELFQYQKNNMGVDLGYKLTPKTKVGVGYEFLKLNRERPDAESTTDNSVYSEVKNSSLGWLTAKVKYQRLLRSSDFKNSTAGTGTTDPLYIERYVRRYDATDKIQDAVKIGLDMAFLEHLDLGLEYVYKKNDYKDTTLGRLSDTRNEVYADVSYTMPDRFKLTAFVDYEKVINDSYHRNITPSGTYSYDPNSAPVANSYNWQATLEDINWFYGLGLEVPVIKNKLDFVASWSYEKANGQADFSSQKNFGTPVNIAPYDDYSKQGLNLKAIYKAINNLELTLGFAYERYTYNDAQYDGYSYVMNSTTSPNTYLTGAYKDSDYNVNMFYVMASYKF